MPIYLLPLRVCVVVFTICTGMLWAEATKQPSQKPIIKSEAVAASEEEVWGMESSKRTMVIYPSIWGHSGIFRVRSAESLPAGSLSFGIGGEFYSVSNAPTFSGSSNARTIAESLFVGFVATDKLTIGVQRRNSSTTFGNPNQLISSLGDFTFSGIYSFKVTESLSVAPILNFVVASNFNSLSPSVTTLSAGVGGAVTYSLFNSLSAPIFLHFNALYHSPQITESKIGQPVEPEIFFGFSRFHTMSLGLGAEWVLGDFIPFLEFYDTFNFSSGVSFGSSPSKVSLGSRFTPLSNKSLAFLLGFDIGLGKGIVSGVPYTPDYQIIGSVSYTVGLTQTERKHYYTSKDVNIVDRKFIIKKNIKFKLNSAILEESSKGLLDDIAKVIKDNNIKKLLVVGHTDSTHTEEYNLKLSISRANAVKDYLASQGVEKDSMIAQGYGKRKPIATNNTEEGRAKNRRVEFFILE